MHGSMHTDGASNHPSRVPPNLLSSHQGTPLNSNLPAPKNLIATEHSIPPSGEQSNPLTSTIDQQLDTGDTTIATIDGRADKEPDLDEETLVDEGKRDDMTEQPMSSQTFMAADKETTSVEGDFIEAVEEEDFEQQMNDDYLEAKEEQLEAMRSSAREEQDGKDSEAQLLAEETTLGYLETVADAVDVEGELKGLEVDGDYLEAIEEESSGQQRAADYLEAIEDRAKATRSSTWEDEDLEATEDRAKASGSSTWEDEDLEATEERVKAIGFSFREDEDLEATEDRAKASGSSNWEDEDLKATEEREKATGSSTWEDEDLEATEERVKAIGFSFREDEDLEATEDRAKASGSSTWEDEDLEAKEDRAKATGSSTWEDEDLKTAEGQAEVASQDKTKTDTDTFDVGGPTKGLEVESDYIEAVEEEASGQQMTVDFLEAAEEQLEAVRSSDSENKDREADVTSLGKLGAVVDALDARGQNRDPEFNPKKVGDKLDWLGREKAGILVEAVTSEDELYSAEPLEDGSGSRKQGPTFKEKFVITVH